MFCPYCDADEEYPPSPCTSFAVFKCGTEYRDGEYYQSDFCEGKAEFNELVEKVQKLEAKLCRIGQ